MDLRREWPHSANPNRLCRPPAGGRARSGDRLAALFLVFLVQIPITIEVLGVAMVRGGQFRRLRGGFLCVLAAIITGVPPSQAQDDDAQRQQQVLFNGEVQVPPGKRYNLTFTTRSNFRNAQIAGSVQAQGGAGNDIRVLVAKGQSLIYDSGRRRSVVMSVDCSEAGHYVLMFDNSFSLVSPKIVAGTISLVHWGVNVEQNEADRQEAITHYTQASGIMQRLYAALKADERVWGTAQLFAVPAIRLNNESSINAAASWATNSIQVNRGLFRLTDRAGDKGEDVLAATLAHEMSHIFYRHPGYGPFWPGRKGAFRRAARRDGARSRSGNGSRYSWHPGGVPGRIRPTRNADSDAAIRAARQQRQQLYEKSSRSGREV